MSLLTLLDVLGHGIYGNAPTLNPDYVPPGTDESLLRSNPDMQGPATPNAIGTPARQPGFWENLLNPAVAAKEKELNNQETLARNKQAIINSIGANQFGLTRNLEHPTFGGNNTQGYLMFGGGGESPSQAANETESLGRISRGVPDINADSDLFSAIGSRDKANMFSQTMGKLLAGGHGANEATNILSMDELEGLKNAVDKGLIPARGQLETAQNKFDIDKLALGQDLFNKTKPYLLQQGLNRAVGGTYESSMVPTGDGRVASVDWNNGTVSIPPTELEKAQAAVNGGLVKTTPDGIQIKVPLKDKVVNVLGDKGPHPLAHDDDNIKELVDAYKQEVDTNGHTEKAKKLYNAIESRHAELNTTAKKPAIVPAIGAASTNWKPTISPEEKAIREERFKRLVSGAEGIPFNFQ